MATADSFVSSRYPDFDKSKKKLVMRVLGDQWEITYELSDSELGGAPVVLIEQKTGKVKRSYRYQLDLPRFHGHI